MRDETIRGYRVGTEPTKPSRELKMDYLHPKQDAAAALRDLRKGIAKRGANCTDRPEFTSDDLMSEREAKLACASCPVFDLCKAYFEVARPAHGVYAGIVKRMDIGEDE